MDDTQFAELWLDTHAEGGTINDMVKNYRQAVPECNASDGSLKTALSTRATKIRAELIALVKSEDEVAKLFPKFPRATKTKQNLASAVARILEMAGKAEPEGE
jgi:hypothetical protein